MGVVMLCGCAGSQGSVTGRLLLQNGPLVTGYHPVPGTITAISTSGKRFVATADAAGHFALKLPAGRYRMIGRSPQYYSNADCVSEDVTVKGGRRAINDVYCQTP